MAERTTGRRWRVEAMSRVARHIDARATRRDAPGDAEARWRAIGDELRACMDTGDAPSAPRARAAARAALARMLDFTGGDPATLDALARLRRLAPPKNLAGWDPALIQYLDQALASLQETENEPCSTNGSRSKSVHHSSTS